MDLPVAAEDALAQPTRAQIFTFLVEKRGPAGTEELAEHFSLHPNGIRRHLERLIEGENGFSCRLGNCPYRDSVKENQAVVCGLHRGITAGILTELDPGAKLTGFEPRDPERAGCLIEVRTG